MSPPRCVGWPPPQLGLLASVEVPWAAVTWSGLRNRRRLLARPAQFIVVEVATKCAVVGDVQMHGSVPEMLDVVDAGVAPQLEPFVGKRPVRHAGVVTKNMFSVLAEDGDAGGYGHAWRRRRTCVWRLQRTSTFVRRRSDVSRLARRLWTTALLGRQSRHHGRTSDAIRCQRRTTPPRRRSKRVSFCCRTASL